MAGSRLNDLRVSHWAIVVLSFAAAFLAHAADELRPTFASEVATPQEQTDTYGSSFLGGVQTQFIDRVSFEVTEPGRFLVRVYARHGRIKLRADYDSPRLPMPKVSRYEIDFRLEGEEFKVTPSTAAAARLFGVNTK